MQSYDVIVIGGGHGGAEAAWAASNLQMRTLLVTMDPSKIGTMSCNPAIGGLAKGQMVREIDALGGLMGLAADASGIQFRLLNRSKGPAVRGPRCQCDKYRYALEVQRLLATRSHLDITAGTVESIEVERGRIVGVVVGGPTARRFDTGAVVLTTGTFMRGLMHTGRRQTDGGRVGERAAWGISDWLVRMGFELGRLKTGTPPRLDAQTIDFVGLVVQPGDAQPEPFSDMTGAGGGTGHLSCQSSEERVFPVLEQRPCWITHTNPTIHDAIRANLDRAPLYNGQIGRDSAGPRYCPSIEDKVVRFADRCSHHVYLEPESLETDEIYCNGISTSLPRDVQEVMVRHLPGCHQAKILRYGYAVEYDMVRPHQIDATCMTKRIEGLFLAGQINGTSGYEEAAGQGLLGGLNAARYVGNKPLVRLGRDQAYIGVMMDDLVTKTPTEPYRMFTSRAEFRLLLRSDNADVRLTPLGHQWGLVDDSRWRVFQKRQEAYQQLQQEAGSWIAHKDMDMDSVLARSKGDRRVIARLAAEIKYAGYIARQRREVSRLADQEHTRLPTASRFYTSMTGLRNEARAALEKFLPVTLGQAARLAGVTPADLMLLGVAVRR